MECLSRTTFKDSLPEKWKIMFFKQCFKREHLTYQTTTVKKIHKVNRF